MYLVLVSCDLLVSQEFFEEVDFALQRMDRKEATIVPIVLRACDWKSTALGSLQPLPQPDGVPVSDPLNDPVWLDVVTALSVTVKKRLAELNLFELNSATNE